MIIYDMSGRYHYKAMFLIEFLIFITSILSICVITDNYDQSLWFYTTILPLTLFYTFAFLMLMSLFLMLSLLIYTVLKKLKFKFVRLDRWIARIFEYSVYFFYALMLLMLNIYICFCIVGYITS